MTKTPREILTKLVKDCEGICGPEHIEFREAMDEALVSLGNYAEENKQSEQWILSRVEIDKDWVKDLILRSGLVTEVGAERIAEGMKIYNPIKLIGGKK